MEKEFNQNKTGLSFNLKYIKKHEPDIWEKHRLMLALVGDIDKIYMNELIEIVGGNAAVEFMNDTMPAPMRECMEGKITMEECMNKMEKYIVKNKN